ncbi:MAG TPA: ABC transporter substrate-binding protein [Gemmatimonadales bacterium]
MTTSSKISFLMAALALSGCETRDPCVGTCATAVITVGADADVLFPPLSQGNVSQAVAAQLFLKLADIGLGMNTVGDSGFVPKLAESWTYEDSLTLVFRLHPAARWHDGVPVSAGDVEFTFDVYLDPLVNAPAGPLLESIVSVTARDERTVSFTFSRWHAEQLYDATHHMLILPKHLLDTIPRDRMGSHPLVRAPIGSGPYRFVEWRAGESIELAADSTFFLGAPGIGRLIWRVTPDFATSLTQVVTGEADILEAVLGEENVTRARGAEHLRVVEYPSGVYVYVAFNVTAAGDPDRPHPVLGDRNVRRAVVLATDRQSILQSVLGGLGQVPGGPTTPMVRIWRDDMRQLPFDSTRAGRLLDSVGWRDSDADGVRDRHGTPLRFDLMYPSSSQVRAQAAVIMQEQLRRVGVDVQLRVLEPNAMVDRANQGRFDAMVGAWQVDPPPGAIRQLWSSAGIPGSNYGRYASAAFDAALQRAVNEGDPTAAQRRWEEAIGIINEDAPAMWLFTPTLVAAVAVRFHNVTIRPDLWSATLWQWTAQ